MYGSDVSYQNKWNIDKMKLLTRTGIKWTNIWYIFHLICLWYLSNLTATINVEGNPIFTKVQDPCDTISMACSNDSMSSHTRPDEIDLRNHSCVERGYFIDSASLQLPRQVIICLAEHLEACICSCQPSSQSDLSVLSAFCNESYSSWRDNATLDIANMSFLAIPNRWQDPVVLRPDVPKRFIKFSRKDTKMIKQLQFLIRGKNLTALLIKSNRISPVPNQSLDLGSNQPKQEPTKTDYIKSANEIKSTAIEHSNEDKFSDFRNLLSSLRNSEYKEDFKFLRNGDRQQDSSFAFSGIITDDSPMSGSAIAIFVLILVILLVGIILILYAK